MIAVEESLEDPGKIYCFGAVLGHYSSLSFSHQVRARAQNI